MDASPACMNRTRRACQRGTTRGGPPLGRNQGTAQDEDAKTTLTQTCPTRSTAVWSGLGKGAPATDEVQQVRVLAPHSALVAAEARPTQTLAAQGRVGVRGLVFTDEACHAAPCKRSNAPRENKGSPRARLWRR
eukprot:2852805-Pleurochrysis_carterae.AAC.2